MRMSERPPPYPKKIDLSERLYYHYKVDASTYALYDSKLSTPIAYGSYNFVGATVTNLPLSSTIFYYEIDRQLGWKMKRRYNPERQPIESNVAAEAVDKTEDKKSEKT